MPLLVTVAEKKPYYFELGGGYQSDKGFYGRSKAGDNNLGGTAKDIWLGTEISQVGYRWDLGFGEPTPAGNPHRIGCRPVHSNAANPLTRISVPIPAVDPLICRDRGRLTLLPTSDCVTSVASNICATATPLLKIRPYMNPGPRLSPHLPSILTIGTLLSVLEKGGWPFARWIFPRAWTTNWMIFLNTASMSAGSSR